MGPTRVPARQWPTGFGRKMGFVFGPPDRCWPLYACAGGQPNFRIQVPVQIRNVAVLYADGSSLMKFLESLYRKHTHSRREHWQRYVKALRPVHDQVVYCYLISVEGEKVRPFFFFGIKIHSTISCSIALAQCRERERRSLRPQMDAGQSY